MDSFVLKKYLQFYEKHGYIPQMFNAYNCAEITDYAPTQTHNCGCKESSAAILIIEFTEK